MTTLKFRGSSFFYQPTHRPTPVDSKMAKYRGCEYFVHRAIATTDQEKNLKYRGINY